ncbi:hypothetical protein ABKV19_022824 [Rosa sericea]
MSGDWKDLEYKDFNLNAKGAPTERGCLHPLLKVRKQLKDIFLQMGFGEMPTNNYVESRDLLPKHKTLDSYDQECSIRRPCPTVISTHA